MARTRAAASRAAILLAGGVLALMLSPPANEPRSGNTDLHEFEAFEHPPEANGAYRTAQDRLYLFGCLSISPLVLATSVVTGHIGLKSPSASDL
jgi:hypothetical protein